MDDLTAGRVLRAVRLRRGWRQGDVAVRAGLSQQEVSEAELGRFEDLTVRSLRRIGRALDVELPFAPRWRGPELDRLLDARHAAIVDLVVRELTALGWVTRPEWSFNHFGERGSVDVLAWHPEFRALLIVEVKTRIVDVQDLLATHDRKVRVARILAPVEPGWAPTCVGRLLVLPEGSTARDAVRRHAATFSSVYPGRNREARAWLRRPVGPLGAILFVRESGTADAGRRGERVPRQAGDRAERQPAADGDRAPVEPRSEHHL